MQLLAIISNFCVLGTPYSNYLQGIRLISWLSILWYSREATILINVTGVNIKHWMKYEWWLDYLDLKILYPLLQYMVYPLLWDTGVSVSCVKGCRVLKVLFNLEKWLVVIHILQRNIVIFFKAASEKSFRQALFHPLCWNYISLQTEVSGALPV